MTGADRAGGYTAVVARLGPADDVDALLREVDGQGVPPDAVLVLDDGAAFRSARRRASVAARPGWRVLPVAAGSAPAARNAALREARSPFVLFLEPGLRLDPTYAGRALERLRAPAAPAFVTTEWTLVVHGTARPMAAGATLEELLASTEAVPPAAMLAREAWAAAGGYDESLGDLFDLDLALRIVAAGGRGAHIAGGPLVALEAAASAAWRRRLDRDRYLPDLLALFAKHRGLFDAHPAAALLGRERRVLELWDRYRLVEARHAEYEREVEALRRAIDEEVSFLRSRGRAAVELGDLRRAYPLDPDWGYARGKPVDRRYIEQFLAENAEDVRGVVLEIQEDDYTRAYGGGRVERTEILDVVAGNPRATVVDDLRTAERLASDAYDCIILTQTLHVIDDVEAVLRQCFRILRPGGVLLATLPTLSRVCLEYGPEGDLWRYTEAGARHVFRAAFPDDAIRTTAYGNVLASAAFLYGLGAHELDDREYAVFDRYNPTLIGVRARKPGSPAGRSAAPRVPPRPPRALVLLYHRVADAGSDVHGLCVRPDTFAAQVRTLARAFRPLGLEELVTRAAAGDVPDGAVAVTFDDAYEDALAAAVPVLDEAGVPATFFACSEPAAETPEYFWDTLERALLASDAPAPAIRVRLSGREEELPLADAEARRRAHDRLHGHLVRAPLAERREVMRQLARALPAAGRPRRRLDAAGLRALAGGGHAVGAHGVHHLALSHQPEEIVRQEVMESRVALERLLGRPVTSFAYPYGDVSDAAVELVGAAGFTVAVTCEEGPVRARVHRFRVPRVEVKEGPVESFEARLRGLLGA